MSNRIPLPPPALTQHPSGNVYFSPQQMQEHADQAVRSVLTEIGLQSWKEVLDHCAGQGISAADVEEAVFGKKSPELSR